MKMKDMPMGLEENEMQNEMNIEKQEMVNGGNNMDDIFQEVQKIKDTIEDVIKSIDDAKNRLATQLASLESEES